VHAAYGEGHAIHDRADRLPYEREVEARHIREAAHHVALHGGQRCSRRHAGHNDELLRGAAQRRRFEHREEVGLEPPPVHFARAREHGGDRHALHVPGDRVTKGHAHLAGDILFER
jgi:hypothetical protein